MKEFVCIFNLSASSYKCSFSPHTLFGFSFEISMFEFSVISLTPYLFPFLLNLKMLTLVNLYGRLQVFLYHKPDIKLPYLLLIHVCVLRRNIWILKCLSASVHSLICCLRSLLAIIYVAKVLVNF